MKPLTRFSGPSSRDRSPANSWPFGAQPCLQNEYVSLEISSRWEERVERTEATIRISRVRLTGCPNFFPDSVDFRPRIKKAAVGLPKTLLFVRARFFSF